MGNRRELKKDRYFLYGRRVFEEFLASRSQSGPWDDIESILAAPAFLENFPPTPNGFPRDRIRKTDTRAIDESYPDLNHQGIVVLFKPGRSPHESRGEASDWRAPLRSPGGLIVALDGMQDPRNTGGIIRTAEALGARALYLSGRGSGLTPAADRASAGAAFHLPLFEIASPDRLLDRARDGGYWIVVAHGGEAPASKAVSVTTRTLERLPPTKELLLFIGAEGRGPRPLILKKADFILSIPLAGRVSSLNAGVAAGILIERLLGREPDTAG